MNALEPQEGAQEEGLLAGLEAVRRRKGWTTAELARRSGLHPNYLGSLERKERNCSLKVLNALSALLESNPNELLAYGAAEPSPRSEGVIKAS